MFLSEFSEAIRLLITNSSYRTLNLSVEGQYLLAPAAAFWLTIAAFSRARMMENGVKHQPRAVAFLVKRSRLCVNFWVIWIKHSSITMEVLLTARTILTICVA